MRTSFVAKTLMIPPLAASMSLASAYDEPHQPYATGIETPGYVWNEMRGEKLIALKAQGDPVRGEIAFEICQGCHNPNAGGEPDGSYPRLAGQHATVLIKQLTDVRAGVRDNQKMYPYAGEHVISPREIADIASYLEQLPEPDTIGQGPGTELDQAEKVYGDYCQECHGDRGQGDADEFYPRVGGQHYAYLLRELRMIRDGRRRNAHPKMLEAAKELNETQLQTLADYIGRLPGKSKQ